MALEVLCTRDFESFQWVWTVCRAYVVEEIGETERSVQAKDKAQHGTTDQQDFPWVSRPETADCLDRLAQRLMLEVVVQNDQCHRTAEPDPVQPVEVAPQLAGVDSG